MGDIVLAGSGIKVLDSMSALTPLSERLPNNAVIESFVYGENKSTRNAFYAVATVTLYGKHRFVKFYGSIGSKGSIKLKSTTGEVASKACWNAALNGKLKNGYEFGVILTRDGVRVMLGDHPDSTKNYFIASPKLETPLKTPLKKDPLNVLLEML